MWVAASAAAAPRPTLSAFARFRAQSNPLENTRSGSSGASRIDHRRSVGDGEWAGRHALVIDEAWKLVEHELAGRWFNELVRRSRHLALWVIAISRQLSDFDNEYGRACFAMPPMRLFHSSRCHGALVSRFGLSDEVSAISAVRTVKLEFATLSL